MISNYLPSSKRKRLRMKIKKNGVLYKFLYDFPFPLISLNATLTKFVICSTLVM